MKKTIPLFILLNLAFTQISCAKNTPSFPECRTTQPAWGSEFNKVYQVDEFKIYYSDLANSRNKLPNMQDLNSNNIPDYVENIAIQAQSSRDIFKYAGFISPLDKPRYTNAKSIGIFLKTMDGNGVAYEGIRRHDNLSTVIEMPCSISIDVSNNLDQFPANYWTTVTHELFHLYQYGYSQFKNSWYLESLANWAERGLKLDITNSTKSLPPLPQNSTELEEKVFSQSYTPMWRRLFLIYEKDKLVIPNHLKDRTYTDGSKVYKDDEWRGTHLVLNIMNNLEKESDKITKQENWPNYFWKEDDQRSKRWDPVIFNIIQKQIKQAKINTPEAQFIKTTEIKSIQ